MVTMVPHVIFLLWLFQPFAQGLSICFTFSALSLSVLQFSFWIWFKPGKFLFNPHYDLHLASSLGSSMWMIFYIFIRIPSVLKVNVSYRRLPLHKHPIWKWYLVLRWYHTGGHNTIQLSAVLWNMKKAELKYNFDFDDKESEWLCTPTTATQCF